MAAIEFDEFLTSHVGNFGCYQLLFLLGGPSSSLLLTLSIFEYNFIGTPPDFRCNVPELDNLNLTNDQFTRYVSPPTSGRSSGYRVDACLVYDRDYWHVSREDVEKFINSNASDYQLNTTECTSWIYDTTVASNTIVAEWDLVCGRRWMVAASQTVYMAGQFLVVLSGILSDKYGRRFACLAMLVLHIAARLVTTCAVNIYMFTVGRFLLSVADCGWYTAMFVLGVELVGPEWRVMASMIPNYFFLLGYCLVAGLAYFFRAWRHLLAVGSVLTVPYLLHFCLLDESPRWLNAQGRTREAKVILRRMARVNGRKMSSDVELPTRRPSQVAQSSSLIDLFRSWYYVRITLILFVLWNVITLAYYGLIFYLPNLGGDPYLALTLSGLTEMPAAVYSQLTMNTCLGRRRNLIVCFMLSGITLLSITLLPKDMPWLVVGIAILGKWGIAANWNFIYLITSELYPTRLRNVGLSTCSMMGRLAGTLSPLITFMAELDPTVPMVLLGALSVGAGLLSLLLPETRGQALTDALVVTVVSAEDEADGIPQSLLDNNKKKEAKEKEAKEKLEKQPLLRGKAKNKTYV